MKKSKVTRSLLAACSIVALSVVLSGCLGSSDGPTQAELDAEAERAAAAEQAAKDAAAAQAAAEQQVAALQTQINGLRTQLGLEADDSLSDDIADLQAEVERLQAALQARIDAANAAAAKAASDAAKALLPVLANSATNQNADNQDVHTPPEPMLSVSNDGMLMAKVENVAGYTMSDMSSDMIEGWRGAMLTNKEGDTAVVYSDIGNDGTQTLLDRYVSNLPTATSPRTWTIGTASNQVGWSVVTRPDNESVVSGPVSAPMVTFKGNVHNISGTFSCAGAVADCVAPVRYSDGEVAPTATGTWSFVPDEGALTYTDDPNYLIFGWWLSKGPDGKADDLTLIADDVGLGAARATDNTSGNAITGSATYNGAAAGQYAMASTTADTYEGGHFTATATLEVDFDADATAGGTNDRAGVAISGTIDNFMTGDMARDSWMVKLMVDNDANGTNPVLPVTSLVVPDGARMLTEWSTGAAAKGTGTWTATWHDGQTEARSTAHPAAVTGTFNAHIGTVDADTGAIGRIQGAFGANKMDE